MRRVDTITLTRLTLPSEATQKWTAEVYGEGVNFWGANSHNLTDLMERLIFALKTIGAVE